MAGVPRPQLPAEATWCKIVRPAAGSKLKVICLSDLYAGMWTHWNGKTTWCPGPKKCVCDNGREEKCERRWRGYLPCISWDTGRRVALELTPSMATAVDLWAAKGEELRGELLVATRGSTRPNGPILLERCGKAPTIDRLPAGFDPTWCVLAILGVPFGRIEEMMTREESLLVLRLNPHQRTAN